MMKENDIYLTYLTSLSEKVDKLDQELSDIKSLLQQEVSALKLNQSKCDGKWSIAEKTIAYGIGGLSLGGVFNWLFGKH